jgi:hypothetical protein
MKQAEDHAKFIGELTAELGQLFEAASSDIDRISMFVEFIVDRVFEHGYGHGVEDAVKATDNVTKDGYPRGEDGDVAKMYSSDGWYTGEEAGP